MAEFALGSVPEDVADRAEQLCKKFNNLVLSGDNPVDGDPPGCNWHIDLTRKLRKEQKKAKS